MNGNGFREDELVTRKMKVNGEWQSRVFPVVGGRLRIAHEENDELSIDSDVIRFDDELAVVKATAVTPKGSYCGFGTASAQRDARLADSLLELAQTRSIARALRFAGYGVEYTGAEEVTHISDEKSEPSQQHCGGNGNGNGNEARSKTQRCGTDRATQAQCRALYALSRKAKYHEDDVVKILAPFDASRFEDLPKEAASKLISHMQTEVAQ